MTYYFSKEKINKEIEQLEKAGYYKNLVGDLNALYKLAGIKKRIVTSSKDKVPDIHGVFYMLLPEIDKFATETKYTTSLFHKHLNRIDLSADECLTLINDFYKAKGKEIYNAFLEVYKNNKTNLNFEYSDIDKGTTTYITKFNESYIEVNRNGTINDVIDLAHEFGHAISFKLYNEKILNDYFVLCRELDGTFYQIEFTKYLIEKDLYKKEAIKSMMAYNIRMSSEAFELLDEYSLYKIMYVIAYMITIELLNKENKDEIIKGIYELNPSSHVELYDYILEKILFINNESFQKELKKDYDSVRTTSFSMNW